MNERIRELMEKADYNAPGGQWKEYFAELIVKECITVLDKKDPDFNDYSKRVVKEHFGVK